MDELEKALREEFGMDPEKIAESAVNSTFKRNMSSWVNRLTDDYLKYSGDLNQDIAKVGKENNLNQDQLSRIAEEVNVQVYLKKYAKTKGQNIRRVFFDIADMKKIASLLGKEESEQVKPSSPDKGTKKEVEKTASYNKGPTPFTKEAFEDNGFGEKKAFLNSADNYDPGMWDAQQLQKTRRDIVSKRVIEKLGEESAKSAKTTKEILWKVAMVGDSLIRYAHMGYDINSSFQKLASDSQMEKHIQRPVIEYVLSKSAELKSAHKLPQMVNTDLDYVTMEKSAFSLGGHSLLEKKASDGLPDILVNNRLVEYDTLLSHIEDLKQLVRW